MTSASAATRHTPHHSLLIVGPGRYHIICAGRRHDTPHNTDTHYLPTYCNPTGHFIFFPTYQLISGWAAACCPTLGLLQLRRSRAAFIQPAVAQREWRGEAWASVVGIGHS